MHIVVAGAAVMIGNGLTVTLTVPVFWHPDKSVAVTVYTVVVVGLADGLLQVVHDKPAAGVHT